MLQVSFLVPQNMDNYCNPEIGTRIKWRTL